MVEQITANSDVSMAVAKSAAPVRAEVSRPVEPSPEKAIAENALTLEKMEAIIQVANAALESANNSLKFQMDDSLNRPIVSVVDQDSGEVIRQLPSEELVRIARSIESMRGVLFDSTT